MGWFKNQGERHAAAKEAKARGEQFKGLPGSRQRKINDRMDAGIARLEEKQAEAERKVAERKAQQH